MIASVILGVATIANSAHGQTPTDTSRASARPPVFQAPPRSGTPGDTNVRKSVGNPPPLVPPPAGASPGAVEPPPNPLQRTLRASSAADDTTASFSRAGSLPLDSIAPPAPTSEVRDVVIDGRFGIVLGPGDGKTAVPATKTLRFHSSDFVRITVVNVNPLLFTYAISVGDTQVVTEASPADFFKLAFGVTLPSTGTPPAKAAGVPPSLDSVRATRQRLQRDSADKRRARAAALGLAPACQDRYVELGQRADSVATLRDSARVLFQLARDAQRAIDGDFRPYWDALQDTRYGAKTVRLYAFRADSIAHQVTQTVTTDHSALDALIPIHSAVADTLARKERTFDTTATCHKNTDWKAAADAAVADTVVFGKALSALAQLTGALDKQQTALDAVWSDETRFWKSLVLKRHSQGNDVIVTIARRRISSVGMDSTSAPTGAGAPSKPDTSKADNTTTTTITTTTTTTSAGTTAAPAAKGKAPKGKPAPTPSPGQSASATPYDTIAQPVLHYRTIGRFSIGAGFIYGALPAPQFGTVQRHTTAPPGSPGDTIAHIVTTTDNSVFRVIPAVTLSALLWDWNNDIVDGLHITIGAGVLPKSGDVTVDYLIGVSVGLLNSRVFVTPGVYIGRQNYLLSGVHVGDAIGSTTAPTGSRFEAQFGLGLTYRLY
jgi:hypothetical protein